MIGLLSGLWLVLATHALAVGAPLKLDFKVHAAEQPLNGERAAAIAPALMNPATRPWVFESTAEWMSETSKLQITTILHTRQEPACRERALKEGQAAMNVWQTWVRARVGQAQSVTQDSAALKLWIERQRTEFLTESRAATPCLARAAELVSSQKPRLLARAPMKLWRGKPTIRASVRAGGVTMNGQFLLDVGAAQSSLSPLFLDFQGVPTDWFANTARPARILPWSYRYGGEGFAADEGQIDRLDIAGLAMPPRWMRILESEIAEPPQSPGACCDGVLGLDVLRAYPVEWRMDEPYELLIWSRESFDPGPEFVAVAVEEAAHGVLQSPGCRLESSAHDQKSRRKLDTVRWMTSLSSSVELSTPNASALKTPGSWKLQCDLLAGSPAEMHTSFALLQWPPSERTDWSVARPPSQWSKTGVEFPEREVSPAVALGTSAFLRGRVILDLPHGKLWFHRTGIEFLTAAGDWGGVLEYRISDGERTLWMKRTPAFSRFWSPQGTLEPPLGKWVQVRKINGRDPAGWDVSVMERVFRGMGQDAGAGLDRGKLELVWFSPDAAQTTSRWNARSSSQR